MTDLVTFLKARLDEDEAAVNAVVFADRDASKPWPPDQAPGYGGPALTAYLKHFGEARMLRDMEAKRAIVGYEDAGGFRGLHIDGWGVWTDVLKHLADAYSDHPDYQPGWSLASPASGAKRKAQP